MNTKIVTKGVTGKRGFTLVELLIVVGIIVALAAVIVPNVVQFGGKGTEGARASELSTVQTAMDTMLADKNITAVTATTAAPADFSSTIGTGSAALGGYMRSPTTTFSYCWTAAGKVTNKSGSTLLASGTSCS